MLIYSGTDDLLPLMLLGGGLGKGGKGGLNSLLPFLLLGDKCKNPAGCIEPNKISGQLCGAGGGSSAGPCCIYPKKTSLFG